MRARTEQERRALIIHLALDTTSYAREMGEGARIRVTGQSATVAQVDQSQMGFRVQMMMSAELMRTPDGVIQRAAEGDQRLFDEAQISEVVNTIKEQVEEHTQMMRRTIQRNNLALDATRHYSIVDKSIPSILGLVTNETVAPSSREAADVVRQARAGTACGYESGC